MNATTSPFEQLQAHLNTLGLKAAEQRLKALIEQATQKQPSYAELLDGVLGCEIEARRTRYLRARLQLAHLPFLKTFEHFDFGFQPPSTSGRSASCARSGSSTYTMGLRLLETPISCTRPRLHRPYNVDLQFRCRSNRPAPVQRSTIQGWWQGQTTLLTRRHHEHTVKRRPR